MPGDDHMRPWRHWNPFFAILTAPLVLLASCDSPSEPDDSQPEAVDRDEPSVRVSPRMTDDEGFAQLENLIPGFGGMYLDSAGVLTVFLSDVSRASEARASLESLREIGPGAATASEWNVRFRSGSYTFGTLLEWKRTLSSRVFEIGATFVDIDDRSNDILVGLSHTVSEADVRAIAQRLNIPDDALRTVVTGELRVTSTLRDRVRPLIGGLQVEWGVFPENTCTMTGNVFHTNFGYSVLTASHCSATTFNTDNSSYYQNENHGTDTHIGTEVKDPSLFTGSPCPSGLSCRWSDATLVQLDDTVGSNIGEIARPQCSTFNCGLTIQSGNPMELRNSDPHQICEMVNGNPCALVGFFVHKVGRTTSMTYGTITHQCVTISHPHGGNMLCQNLADYDSDGGDSGAPVIYCGNLFCEGIDLVELLGIHWSEFEAGPYEGLAVFSQMRDVRKDVGVSGVSCSGMYMRPTTQFPC